MDGTRHLDESTHSQSAIRAQQGVSDLSSGFPAVGAAIELCVLFVTPDKDVSRFACLIDSIN